MATKPKYGNSKDLINLSGKKFGKLTAIEYITHITPNGYESYKWDCLCDCGNKIAVKSDRLVSGKTSKCRTCGISMWSEKKVLPNHKALLNRLFRNYQRAAENRKLEFLLDYEQVVELMKLDCHYCGETPRVNASDKSYYRGIEYKRNGIDRIDSSKGYLTENVVPCCHNCNTAKMDRSYESFMNLVEKIYLKHFRKTLNDYPAREYEAS